MSLDREMKAEKEDQSQTTLADARELTNNALESIIGARTGARRPSSPATKGPRIESK